MGLCLAVGLVAVFRKLFRNIRSVDLATRLQAELFTACNI
jgi:hypothetical protein